MRLDFSIFTAEKELSPAEIKRSGVIMLSLGVFISIVTGCLLAIALGASIPSFLIPDNVRLDQSRREGSSIGAIVLLSTLLIFGVLAAVEGVFRAFFQTKSKWLLRVMLSFVVGIFVAGVIARALSILD
jgi:Na+-driven multidrug efflux pump